LIGVPSAHFSALVVSFNTGPVLDKCLAALEAAPLCRQIVLVNNGNSPQIMASLRARHMPKLTLVDGHGNVGFGRGCNLGAKVAREDLLLLVNPDCLIDAQTLPNLAAALTQHPNALVGGALRNLDGTEQRGCRRGELTLWSAFVSFTRLSRAGAQAGIWRDFNRTQEPRPTTIVDMPVVSGALMAISRDMFDKVEGFDPTFFLHVEDVDLCRRVRQGGERVMFAPDATALHIGATSAASSWAVERAKIASFAHYFWKNAQGVGDYIGVLLVMPIVTVAVIARLVFSR
jgi:N-acetylglucosaminyl-diphospho-decaprenol L-rhamnosyltransferase